MKILLEFFITVFVGLNIRASFGAVEYDFGIHSGYVVLT